MNGPHVEAFYPVSRRTRNSSEKLNTVKRLTGNRCRTVSNPLFPDFAGCFTHFQFSLGVRMRQDSPPGRPYTDWQAYRFLDLLRSRFHIVRSEQGCAPHTGVYPFEWTESAQESWLEFRALTHYGDCTKSFLNCNTWQRAVWYRVDPNNHRRRTGILSVDWWYCAPPSKSEQTQRSATCPSHTQPGLTDLLALPYAKRPLFRWTWSSYRGSWRFCVLNDANVPGTPHRAP